ncbi:MAG: GAF domain-containing protein [Scytolyngbya sp. HA4215-MV1]|nr:GAF domain-containing protein [Scytolyngbya sp. HA4215-MV1]
MKNHSALSQWQQENGFYLWQRIVQIALDGSDSKNRLLRIASTLGKAFYADSCLITIGHTYLTTPQSACWTSARKPLLVEDDALLLKHPTIDAVLRSSAFVKVCDAQAELGHTWNFERVRAIMGTSLQLQDQTDGSLILLKSEPHTWTDFECAGLQAISDQVSVAVTQFYWQQQQRQSHYQGVVNQLTMAIRNSVGLNQILKQAIDGTAQALQVDRGMILRLKYWDPLFNRHTSPETIPTAKATIVYKWTGEESSEVVELSDEETDPAQSTAHALDQTFWLADCSLCQQVFLDSAKPIVITEPKDLLAYGALSAVAPVFEMDVMSALLLVPLQSQHSILGFLVFQHRQTRSWQPEEQELVDLVGAQISTAIIQSETLRQVQALVDKRTAQLKQSLELQAKLYEKTRQQIDQLRHLNQLKDDFIDTVSHELRTPLTSMMLAIRMLRESGLSSQKSAQYLDILEQQCAQETSLVNDLLALQELESRHVSMQLQSVDLKALIQELAQVFQQRWAEKGLTLDISCPAEPFFIQTDLNSLRSILQELLTNAGKYSEPNTVVQLQANRQEKTGNFIEMSLTNIGRGISPQELPHIFEKFRRGQGATQSAIQGTGLGLALVKSLVQNLNGTIGVTSNQSKEIQGYETCFTLTLPQCPDTPR